MTNTSTQLKILNRIMSRLILAEMKIDKKCSEASIEAAKTMIFQDGDDDDIRSELARRFLVDENLRFFICRGDEEYRREIEEYSDVQPLVRFDEVSLIAIVDGPKAMHFKLKYCGK